MNKNATNTPILIALKTINFFYAFQSHLTEKLQCNACKWCPLR